MSLSAIHAAPNHPAALLRVSLAARPLGLTYATVEKRSMETIPKARMPLAPPRGIRFNSDLANLSALLITTMVAYVTSVVAVIKMIQVSHKVAGWNVPSFLSISLGIHRTRLISKAMVIGFFAYRAIFDNIEVLHCALGLRAVG